MKYDAEKFLTGLFQADHEATEPDTMSPDDIPTDWKYHFEERVAIMIHDGGLTREHAEAAALADTIGVLRDAGIVIGKPHRRF